MTPEFGHPVRAFWSCLHFDVAWVTPVVFIVPLSCTHYCIYPNVNLLGRYSKTKMVRSIYTKSLKLRNCQRYVSDSSRYTLKSLVLESSESYKTAKRLVVRIADVIEVNGCMYLYSSGEVSLMLVMSQAAVITTAMLCTECCIQ